MFSCATVVGAWTLMARVVALCRLTAPKENGETIEVDGKKVALGIPGQTKGPNPFAGIPLGRAATPDEAAGGVLL